MACFNKKISIIGGGVMGEVFARRLIDGGFVKAPCITMSDLNKDRLAFLKKKYKVRVSADNTDAIRGASIIILAVKPQNAKEVLNQLKNGRKKDQLFLSIMAGVPIGFLQKILQTNMVVRSMPNTPAQIGKGVVVWHASNGVNKVQKNIARKIFATLGFEQEVKNEDIIDKATAVSGSGPAYVFYFAGCFMDAARSLGFSDADARSLTAYTLRGASELLLQSKENPSVLRERVTSKGGTTEAAFEEIIPHHFEKVLTAAVKKAYKQAKKLSIF